MHDLTVMAYHIYIYLLLSVLYNSRYSAKSIYSYVVYLLRGTSNEGGILDFF